MVFVCIFRRPTQEKALLRSLSGWKLSAGQLLEIRSVLTEAERAKYSLGLLKLLSEEEEGGYYHAGFGRAHLWH